MELKKYQKQVLKDLSNYLKILNETNNIKTAYTKHWNDKDVRVGYGGMPEYRDTITGTPHVCFKVPTGGGKTFIACASLKSFFEQMPLSKTKVVAWLVPSNAILEQTIRTLSDVDHPYRQRIDMDFGGRVEVLTKEQLLNGQGFNPTSVKEQLTICVLSFDSIRSNKKDGRKVYQQNSQLAQFEPFYENPETLIEDVDNTALIQVLNQLSPVVVVDESHNAQSDLSVEMLNNLNPSFVFDLTATPKENSNIISYVDTRELKKENMVKLPVVVYNRNSKQEVVIDAIQLRGNLEKQAIEEEKTTGKYIRPIVLFQAQPKGREDNATFEKLKEELIGLGIPREQIAIKTSNVNEIKGINLMSKDCEIRYIITVNALKEGWDCPFAYILATLANKTSKVDVEQILGRVLRLPYAKKHKNAGLNLSYTLTCSNDFRDTLENIVKGLNKAGFSKKDYRIGETSEPMDNKPFHIEEKVQLEIEEDNKEKEEFLDIDFDEIRQSLENINENKEMDKSDTISDMLEVAMKQNEEYETEIRETEEIGLLGGEIGDMMNQYKIISSYEKSINPIPQFVHKEIVPLLGIDEQVLLTKEFLNDGFTLADKDTQINFILSSNDVYKVDIAVDGEAVPKYQKVAEKESKYFKEYFDALPSEKKVKVCKEMLYNQLNKSDSMVSIDLMEYVDRIVDNMTRDELSTLETSIPSYARKIREKIEQLQLEYREKVFKTMLVTGEITCEPYYNLPMFISPIDSVDSIPKSLYEAETNMNDFEHKVITEIASLDNTLWWHRIIDRKGFCLNGFINHYADFMVMTKNGNLVLVETKGDHLANDESKQKLSIGRLWEAKAGNNYRYLMVFNNKDLKLDGAYTLDEFMGVMRKL
ncbi:DEAD/DEAH box helicase family protein [Tissierella carlieri]|uniref:DEAD/DEAH box helicase n=1 Tax=Tissierella carlieri TaxID=689904 RepID=UPI001C12425F|nr:DEAD/DEAH box helicase family protein [Tissierella carlieri]MBU5314479.1 DEAD/DEAH box helicase family protein [Tissierella carlieri]